MSYRREREQFITSIYQLADELGSAALQESVDQKRLLRLLALAVQSCLGGIATLLEESLGSEVNAVTGVHLEENLKTRAQGGT